MFIIRILVELLTHGRSMMHFMTNVDDFDVISTIYGRFWAGFGLNFYGARFPQVPPAQRAGAEGMPHKSRRVSHHSGASCPISCLKKPPLFSHSGFGG